MRLACLLFLLINLVLLPWTAGLVSPAVPRGEADRLARQLDAERIRVLPVEADAQPVVSATEAPPADATLAEPPVGTRSCRALLGLSREQVDQLAVRVRDSGTALELTESEQGATSSWWVHIPDLATRALADRKQAELRALGVNEMALMPDQDGQKFAISLGLFRTEAGARELLDRLNTQGVRSARIAEREGRGQRWRVELRGSEQALTSVLEGAAELLAAGEQAACQ
ncbi:SPOR domain-containing protein [Methyloversatilis thermotolerans]|uniref:SPOR domain-containing protein n=1 Tax=Methyloversatilis thermotolerans TaxID=1346290 RepID=UPI0003754B02|nr:SPOR domain-containing protein [Methyloversatilis thermotolerans]